MGETQSRPVAVAGSKSSQSGGATAVTPAYLGVVSSLLKPTQKTRCDAAATVPPLPPLPSASAASSSSSAGQMAPPPPPSPNAPEQQSDNSIEAAARSVSGFTNPGPYEQAVNDGKRLVTIDTFDGFRCDINKQVSPFMAVIHSFHLGTSMIPDGRKSSYSFLAQVADEQSLLMARIDPARGSLDGRIHKALLGGAAMGKLQMGVSQEGQNDSLMAEVDFGGSTWTGNLKYGSMGGGLVYGMSFMQAIHPNVAAGGEGMYIAANQNLISSYAMKFNWLGRTAATTGDSDVLDNANKQGAALPPGMPPPEAAGNSVLCVSYNTGQMAATINYKRCVTPNRLVLGAELQFSPFSLDSQVLLGAEYKWQRSKLNLCIDGGLRMQSVLEAKYGMAPGSPSIMLSAEMDHFSDVMKFGYGINIES